MKVSDILVLLVAIVALVALCVFTYCSCRPQLPDFSKWETRDEYMLDVDEDGQADLRIAIYYDSSPLQCSNAVWSYSLLDKDEEEPSELVMWIKLTRDKSRLQKDGAYLVVDHIARFYLKKNGEFHFVQQKAWSRPEEVTEIIEVEIIEPNSSFEKLYSGMLVQAGFSEEKAAYTMPTWEFSPEEPAE
jgi:hypothetical protein